MGRRSPGECSSPLSIWSRGHSSARRSAGLAPRHGVGPRWMLLRSSCPVGSASPRELVNQARLFSVRKMCSDQLVGSFIPLYSEAVMNFQIMSSKCELFL